MIRQSFTVRRDKNGKYFKLDSGYRYGITGRYPYYLHYTQHPCDHCSEGVKQSENRSIPLRLIPIGI